ncbi:hypothetical protein [Pseudoxanthomonas sp.]|uniref:hypothetical protein n=1 Tax=Pseudoxanthomonas sp. TaxID=1871049 RepID=UPI002FE07EEC
MSGVVPCPPSPPAFSWRERPHEADPFGINTHRKVHTLYFDDVPLACIEPSGRGLIARFLPCGIDTPGRPVAVPTVQRGKAFVQNWIQPRQAQVVYSCSRTEMRQNAA